MSRRSHVGQKDHATNSMARAEGKRGENKTSKHPYQRVQIVYFGVRQVAVPQQPDQRQGLPQQRSRGFPRPAADSPLAGSRMVGPAAATATARRRYRRPALAEGVEGLDRCAVPNAATAASQVSVGKDAAYVATVAMGGIVELFTRRPAALPHSRFRRFGRPPSARVACRHHSLALATSSG